MTNNRITFKGSEYEVTQVLRNNEGEIALMNVRRIDKPKEKTDEQQIKNDMYLKVGELIVNLVDANLELVRTKIAEALKGKK